MKGLKERPGVSARLLKDEVPVGGESRLAALAGQNLLPVPGVGLVYKRRTEESRGTPRHGQPQVVLYADCIPEWYDACQDFFS
jgi:hypothetical protein